MSQIYAVRRQRSWFENDGGELTPNKSRNRPYEVAFYISD